MIRLKSWIIEGRLTHSYWISKKHLITPTRDALKANCLAMELVQDIEMERFLFMLQTPTSCKWSKVRLGPSSVRFPEDTVLNPLLFSLYINDITSDIESVIRLYADDCVCLLSRN